MPRPDSVPGALLGVVRPPAPSTQPAQPAPHALETEQVRTRRRLIVAATAVVGAVLLGLASAQPKHSSSFALLALLLAATWLIGGLLSGPLPIGTVGTVGAVSTAAGRRQILMPLLWGAISFIVFALGALIVREIPPLHSAVSDVLSRADVGPRWRIATVTLANGVAEEVYFRGALYATLERHRPVWWSTIAYVVVTAASGNVMLVFAAAVMGTLFGAERRATRGVLAPVITHVTWSALMLFLLPR